jgi:hypothetical protein
MARRFQGFFGFRRKRGALMGKGWAGKRNKNRRRGE